MSRMIDLIRESAVPAQIVRLASMGALSLPPAEMIEILVLLAHNPLFGKQARITLAGWDIASSRAVAADPQTPHQVLDYLMAPQNRRPALLPSLLENPAIEEAALLDLAQADSREVVDSMLASARVQRAPNVLRALLTNPHLAPEETKQVRRTLAALAAAPGPGAEDVLAGGPTSYELEHAADIAAEEGKPFELMDGTSEEAAELGKVAVAVPAKVPEILERLSPLQKIARLSVGGRVQLAMKGSRDERFILIRDGSKVVSGAVLESPKINDQEVESFAAMKNVQESVLRGIAGKRKFVKNYAIVRALVNNPRCPLDVSLALIKNLLVNDLKNLAVNKNVPDTIRKVAFKLFRDKTTSGKKAE